MLIFKLQGHEYRPTRPEVREVIAAIIYKATGLRTRTYKTAVQRYAVNWKMHVSYIQEELNAERRAGKVLTGLQ